MIIRKNGFSLLEIIVVVVIVAILALVATPYYHDYLVSSRRSDAKETLLTIQVAEENYRINNTTYSTSVYTDTDSIQGYYTISISSVSPNSYTAQATAKSGTSQTGDTGCTDITLTYSNGSTSKTPAACWND